MDPWVWWLIAALLLLAAEVVAGGTLFFAMVAAGAVAGAVVSAVAPDQVGAAVVACAVVSGVMVLLVRPAAADRIHHRAELRTGVDAVIGSSAVVVSEVNQREGRVKVRGEIWSARSLHPDDVFDVDVDVTVVQVDGATVVVD